MKFYGQSKYNGGVGESPIDEVLYNKYFKDQTKGFYIEAGANDGLFLSSCKVFEDLGWSGFNIEPSRELFDRLMFNRTRTINLNRALSNSNGLTCFDYIGFDNGGFSRISSSKQQHIDDTFGLQVLNEYNVRTQTYKSLIEEFNIKEVDLFVLDVENHELEVVEGMQGCNVLPKVFCIEYSHVGLDKLLIKLQDIYKVDYVDGMNGIFLRK